MKPRLRWFLWRFVASAMLMSFSLYLFSFDWNYGDVLMGIWLIAAVCFVTAIAVWFYSHPEGYSGYDGEGARTGQAGRAQPDRPERLLGGPALFRKVQGAWGLKTSARYDRTTFRFMAGVECMVLALVLLVPIVFPVKFIGAIGLPVVAVMTTVAIILILVSLRLLHRREKDDLDRPYVAPGRGSMGPKDGESILESKADTAKSFYFSDGIGTHLRRGGGRY